MIGDDHSLGGQSNGFDKLVGGFERKRYWGGYRLVTRRGLSERLWCCLRVVILRKRYLERSQKERKTGFAEDRWDKKENLKDFPGTFVFLNYFH